MKYTLSPLLPLEKRAAAAAETLGNYLLAVEEYKQR